jgi:hypothetical protein
MRWLARDFFILFIYLFLQNDVTQRWATGLPAVAAAAVLKSNLLCSPHHHHHQTRHLVPHSKKRRMSSQLLVLTNYPLKTSLISSYSTGWCIAPTLTDPTMAT